MVEQILEKLPPALSGRFEDLRKEIGNATAALNARGVALMPGPNVRNELIQMYQTTEALRKKVESLDEKLSGVIQASLDGQRLDANVKEVFETEHVQPIIQYIQAAAEPSGKLIRTLQVPCAMVYVTN